MCGSFINSTLESWIKVSRYNVVLYHTQANTTHPSLSHVKFHFVTWNQIKKNRKQFISASNVDSTFIDSHILFGLHFLLLYSQLVYRFKKSSSDDRCKGEHKNSYLFRSYNNSKGVLFTQFRLISIRHWPEVNNAFKSCWRSECFLSGTLWYG